MRSLIEVLKREREIVFVETEVDPYLEIAEIHRRIIEENGPAILFTNVRGSRFPVITNIFGTKKRIELAFGSRPEAFIRQAVELSQKIFPPRFETFWKNRDLFLNLLKLGTKTRSSGPITEVEDNEPDLESLPLLQLWPEDGGHFVTLPLVYTESPEDKRPNIGMYRMQRFDKTSTGMHWQIGKGGGFHYYEAEKKGEPLPVTVFLGGPPALIVSAIAPLPEGVPEVIFASLLAGERLPLVERKGHAHRIFAEAEFAICGEVPPVIRRSEGPFGDHYGYYSLGHDYPIFKVSKILHRRDAIYPATVVGKPRQEDFFIGDYLQELLSPIFPIVMPAVIDVWSYGETGFHSLAAAVVRERYGREALTAAFRILGEGQLGLTKFLLITDKPQDLRSFPNLFEYILERVDWSRDFFILSNTSFDTLDYASGKINIGSKAILMGLGEKKRELERQFNSQLPPGIRKAKVFCGGCLALEADEYTSDPELPSRIALMEEFKHWQVVVLLDNIGLAETTAKFLWGVWTRFSPDKDIHAKKTDVENHHLRYQSPIVIDSRMKPWYPKEVEPARETIELVNKRWREYFPSPTNF
ncbi:MAG TPA: UbiD family decarboxylase [Pyrinomonadaceae bacterium]|nr:UbiD family decarboxylase [Pyrinomonadaceae bacterium]